MWCVHVGMYIFVCLCVCMFVCLSVCGVFVCVMSTCEFVYLCKVERKRGTQQHTTRTHSLKKQILSFRIHT